MQIDWELGSHQREREREREREIFDFGEWSKEKKEKWMRVKRGADEI